MIDVWTCPFCPSTESCRDCSTSTSSKGWLAIAKLKPLSLFISLFQHCAFNVPSHWKWWSPWGIFTWCSISGEQVLLHDCWRLQYYWRFTTVLVFTKRRSSHIHNYSMVVFFLSGTRRQLVYWHNLPPAQKQQGTEKQFNQYTSAPNITQRHLIWLEPYVGSNTICYKVQLGQM